jgi:hypothetical protein
MKFQIWHNCLSGHKSFSQDSKDMFPKGYLYIADVETNDINKVYELTNNIDNQWFANPGVTAHCPARYHGRSTSVGDVVVDENGKRFVCASVGWKEF